MPTGRRAVAIRWRRWMRPDRGTDARGPPLPLGARLPRAAPREPGVPLRRRRLQRGSRSPGSPTTACPALRALSNGEYQHRAGVVSRLPLCRGAGSRTRLRGGSGGARRLQLGPGRGDAVLMLSAAGRSAGDSLRGRASPSCAASERGRRAPFASPLERAADAYLVPRGPGKTDHRRLSLVHRLGPRHVHRPARSLPRHRPARRGARRSCSSGPDSVSEGMLPNRFADQGDAPEFNSVDASLWFVIAVHDYLRAVEAAGGRCPASDRQRARRRRSQAIIDGYTPRHPLRHPRSTTTACSRPASPGVQLTWMDAKVGDWVVTPRIGKPVEIQALWLNALAHRRANSTPRSARPLRQGPSSVRRSGSGTRRRAASTTSSTSITCPAPSMPPCGRIRSSPSAACRYAAARRRARRAGGGRRRGALWTPLGLRTLAPARRATRRATKAACASATAPTTRARCGPGCSARLSRPGSGCTAASGRAGRSARGASSSRCWTHLTGGRGPCLGDRRWRRRRTPRGAAPSRPGRWARRFGSISPFSPRPPSRAGQSGNSPMPPRR